MTTRKYTSRSQQTTLTSPVTSGGTLMTVVNISALLGGLTIAAGQTFTVVIDPDTALEEVVDVYSASGNPVSGSNLTIVRAIDGSSAQDHSAGAVIRHMIVGRDLREANTHIEASSSIHGLSSTSSVVGTQDSQTLYNKTLISPVLTGTTENDAGISFQGTTVDSYATTLTVVDPTANRTITFPNTSGTVSIIDAVQTLTNKTITTATLGSDLAADGYKITGLGTPTASTDAVTKTYADANVAAASTSAASAATSATAAATSASSAATSATSAAASVSSISGYATTASNSASAAATSASSAATSATSAAASASSILGAVSASATSAASAATSATAAATSATSAAASATAAATSATSAAASVSAVATSASSALTSQTAAATSATSAAASATAAATSAASAATSATSAATSASSSLTTYNTYKTYYLGSFASAPTLDNQGNALITGATYWNSGSSTMFVWSGSAWSAVSTASGAVTTGTLAQFAATTSAQLAGVISDETGSGQLVFATLPTFGTSGIKLSGFTSGTTQILSAATAGTSVITMPAGTDTLVGKATTDTLTNKTLTTPTVNGLTITGTVTSTATVSGETQNNLTLTGTLTAGGGVGTNGYYLQTTGTGVQWAAITAGSQVKIDSGTGTTYTYIDFLGMGTDTGTSGTVKVQPLTNTGSNTGKRIYSGSTTPSGMITGDLWVDTTVTTDPDLRTMTLMGAY